MPKRHPGARRTQQSQQSEPDDIFLANVLDIGKWAEHNQQLLTILAVLVAIAIAGVIYYGNYRRSLGQQAAQQLESIHQSIAISDTEGAKDQLVTFLERFSGTPYEGEARLLLGDLYLGNGDVEQAEAVLEPLAASPGEPIEFQGAALLAAAYEQDHRPADAERLYLTIADHSKLDFEVKDALTAAARIRASQGNAQGAIQLYQRVLDSLAEDDPERGVYQMRIEELEVSSGT